MYPFVELFNVGSSVMIVPNPWWIYLQFELQ
jgi:hypothetical protein